MKKIFLVLFLPIFFLTGCTRTSLVIINGFHSLALSKGSIIKKTSWIKEDRGIETITKVTIEENKITAEDESKVQ